MFVLSKRSYTKLRFCAEMPKSAKPYNILLPNLSKCVKLKRYSEFKADYKRSKETVSEEVKDRNVRRKI